MAFPDTALSNQFVDDEELDQTKLDARITAQLNLLAARVADSGWITLTLTGSWTVGSSLTPAYRLIGREVQLRGQATGGATTSALGTLPAGYRPAATVTCPIAGISSPYGPVLATVTTGGLINIYFSTGGPQIALEGLRFFIG